MNKKLLFSVVWTLAAHLPFKHRAHAVEMQEEFPSPSECSWVAGIVTKAPHLFKAIKGHSTDESTLQQIYTLGTLTAQYLNHLQTSPTNDANILFSHIFLVASVQSVSKKKRHGEHKPGLPVESRAIKISKCSLRKRVNPLQCGSIQGAVRVHRR